MQKLLHKLKSDESLMLAYQKGDSNAFDVLYARHKDKLFNYLYNSHSDLSIVEELAHDIWLSIIRGIESYNSTALFRTYLYKVARNRLIDYWRVRSDQTNIEFDESIHTHLSFDTDDGRTRSQLESIREALRSLPDEQREAFLLKEEGFSRQEISSITEVNAETVKSRIRYAKSSLQALVEIESI
jgi:RNA polymerase sigma-70 factor (ECF subfamily)